MLAGGVSFAVETRHKPVAVKLELEKLCKRKEEGVVGHLSVGCTLQRHTLIKYTMYMRIVQYMNAHVHMYMHMYNVYTCTCIPGITFYTRGPIHVHVQCHVHVCACTCTLYTCCTYTGKKKTDRKIIYPIIHIQYMYMYIHAYMYIIHVHVHCVLT